MTTDIENEDFLLELAETATVSHLEKVVRLYRKTDRTAELEAANVQRAERSLRCYFDEDGSLVVEGRLDPEHGALVMKALQAAADTLRKAERDSRESSEAPDRPEQPYTTRQADAFALLGETFLANGAVVLAAGAVGRRKLDLVLVHVLPPISPEYARHRDSQLRRIAQMRPQPGGALVLAGDFNVAPYASTFSANFASVFTRAGGLAGTFPAGLPAALRIPIDHVLAAGKVSIRRTIERDIHSDHLPFTVQISVR